MKSAPFAIALLLAPSLASAAPILPPLHCGCSLVELPQEPHVNAPDPGWAPELTLGQIAILKAEDDAHEPMPEPTRWVEVCITPPKGRSNQPEYPHGGGGAGGSGGGGSETPGPVPEPSLLALAAVGVVAAYRRAKAAA